MNQIIQQPQNQAGLTTWLTPQSFEAAGKIAALMAKVGTMPVHLKDKPADCFRIVVQSAKWQMDPFAVGECTSLVHGRLCYEGKLVHAVLISMGAIKGQLNFEYDGKEDTDLRSVIVTGSLADGQVKTIKGMVKDWKTTGNGSPWKPGAYDRQLAYRGTREWARIWAPQAVLGVYTPDEIKEEKTVEHEVVATVHDAPKIGKARTLKAPIAQSEEVKVEAETVEPDDIDPVVVLGADVEPEKKTITYPELQAQVAALWKTSQGKEIVKAQMKVWKIESIKKLAEKESEEMQRFSDKLTEVVAIQTKLHGDLK